MRIPVDEGRSDRRQLRRYGCGAWVYDLTPEQAAAALTRVRGLVIASGRFDESARRVEREYRMDGASQR